MGEDAVETLVEKEKRGSEVKVGDDPKDLGGGGSSGCDSYWVCDNCEAKHASSVLKVCTECQFVRWKKPALPMKGIDEHYLYCMTWSKHMHLITMWMGVSP